MRLGHSGPGTPALQMQMEELTCLRVLHRDKKRVSGNSVTNPVVPI